MLSSFILALVIYGGVTHTLFPIPEDTDFSVPPTRPAIALYRLGLAITFIVIVVLRKACWHVWTGRPVRTPPQPPVLPTLASSYPCALCGKPSVLSCSMCHRVYYCNESHRMEWFHRPYCRPEEKRFKAIHLPDNDARPRMIESVAKRVTSANGDASVLCLPSSLPDVFGNDYPANDEASWVQSICVSPYEKESSRLFILVRWLSLVDGSRPNLCVQQIPGYWVGGRWKGPIAIVRGRPVENWRQCSVPINEFEDVRLTDLEAALTYIRSNYDYNDLHPLHPSGWKYYGLRATVWDYTE